MNSSTRRKGLHFERAFDLWLTRQKRGLAELEKRLCAAADLWANSDLRPSEYSTPFLGFEVVTPELYQKCLVVSHGVAEQGIADGQDTNMRFAVSMG